MPKTVRGPQSPICVPQHVRDLNQIAHKVGLAVDAITRDEDGNLVCRWRGSKRSLIATKLLPPAFNFPQNIPGRHRYFCSAVLRGEVTIEDTGLRVDLRYGPLDNSFGLGRCKSTRETKGVHVTEYEAGTSYYGEREALISSGLCDVRTLPDPRTKKTRGRDSYTGSERCWSSRVWPGGKYIFWIESEEARARRKAKYEETRKRDQQPSRVVLPNYASPEKWLEGKEDLMCSMAEAALKKTYAVTTASGDTFTIDAAALMALINEMEAVFQKIRELPVTVTRTSTHESRVKAASAAHDGDFQRFMRNFVQRPNE